MVTPRDDRDRNLIDAFCGAARTIQHEYREWILGEHKELLPKAQIEEASGNEVFKRRNVSERINKIEAETWDIFRAIDEKMAEVKVVVFDEDLLEAKRELDKELGRLEKLVLEMQSVRKLIDDFQQL